MRSLLFLCTALLFSGMCAQSLPRLGTDSTLDVANWNIEWFGSTAGGPVNESLQQQNVWRVLDSTGMDVWGLCEVSDSQAWIELLNRLPQYEGVISTWNQTQKTALLYHKDKFRLLYQKHILSAYSYDFASGRLPLEVCLETKNAAFTDTLVFIVIHMKANTGTTVEKEIAWIRRKNAGEALKAYINDMDKNRKCLVLGDWNDDLDTSVLQGFESPYMDWVRDSINFKFPFLELTRAGGHSMEAYDHMIDHQCMRGRMQSDFIKHSGNVIYLNKTIEDYATCTSDHYPVFSRFVLVKSPYLSVKWLNNEDYTVYYNGKSFEIKGSECAYIEKILDIHGREVKEIIQNREYIICVKTAGGTVNKKVFTSP